MLEKLQLFEEVEQHFRTSNSSCWWDLLYNALANVYVDVINFMLVTAKHYRSSTISMDYLLSLFQIFPIVGLCIFVVFI